MVKGRSDLFLRLEIIKKIMVIIAIAVTYRWGIMGLLYGQMGTTLISYYLNSYYSGQLIKYSQWCQIKDLFPTFLSAIVMGAFMYFVGWVHIESYFLMIILQTAVGIGVYYLFSLMTSASELKEVQLIATRVGHQIFAKLKVAICQTR